MAKLKANSKTKAVSSRKSKAPADKPRDPVLDAVAQFGPMTADDLREKSGLNEKEFQKSYDSLIQTQQLFINNGGYVFKPNSSKANLVVGEVQITKSGNGFLIPLNGGENDLVLDSYEIGKVLPGDVVVATRIAGRRSYDGKSKDSAKIIDVLTRKLDRVIGKLVVDAGKLMLSPEDPRIGRRFTVVSEGGVVGKKGQVAVAELINTCLLGSRAPCRLIEVLGEVDDPGMEIEIAVRKFDIPYEFSEETKEQVARFADEVTKTDRRNRIDLRDIPFVTIDGADARDFDDAVYCKPLPAQKGWRLLVAIADVSHYVKAGTPLDKDAQSRATSVYFPRRVIPMLPEKLSNGLCSLNPNVDRCAMVCDAMIRPDGEVKAYQFYPALIRSAARLIYDDVWAALQDENGPEAAQMQEVLPNVQVLYDLFKVLLESRKKRGALEFETVETYIVANEQGKIEQILPRERNDAHRLIEEMMLVANTCAADFLQLNKAECLYRIHEAPPEDRLMKLRAVLGPLGLKLNGADKPTPQDYCKLLEEIQGRVDKEVLQTAILRSMQQAYYTPHNDGHFGLAYSAYTHFTSPIRRYPDLLVHRTIRAIITDKKYAPKLLVPLGDFKPTASKVSAAKSEAPATSRSTQIWEQLGLLCSGCERRADEASYDVTAWLKCYYMKSHIGHVYNGKVTAVAPFGIFVGLDDLFVEGSIHVSELGSDYYKYEEMGNYLVGEWTGETFRIGDRVKVRVCDVDLDLRRIEFQLSSRKNDESRESQGGRKSPRGRSRSGGFKKRK